MLKKPTYNSSTNNNDATHHQYHDVDIDFMTHFIIVFCFPVNIFTYNDKLSVKRM